MIAATPDLMAGASETSAPGPATGLVRRLEDLVSSCALMTMVVLPLAEIAGRRLLGHGVPGSIDYVRHLTLWLTLIGAMAAARDGLFPSIFSRMSQQGVPAIGIMLSATLATILVIIQAAGTSGFQSFYSLVVGLSTMAAVIPYAFCAMATGLIAAHGASAMAPRLTIIEIIAFIFAVFTLYGCGAEAVLYGVVLLVLGIPVYVWQRRRASK